MVSAADRTTLLCHTVAYLARDNSSKSSNSYTSHSITSILSFEIEEIEVRKPTAEVAAPNKETTPLDLSEPTVEVPVTNKLSQLKAGIKITSKSSRNSQSE